MRVLWIDADESPWTDANGWRVLEDFGVHVRRLSSADQAQTELSLKNFDLLLVRAELPGASALLAEARRQFGADGRKIVLASSGWSKEQFRIHSKTDGAAHRYARVPMPPEGFLSLLADLFGCLVEELGEFEVAEEEPPAAPKPRKRQASSTGEADGDIDVLRKYLHIKEEQFEISEGERVELAKENERLQREAQQLQSKLREFEHMHDELAKKLAQMEEEKSETEQQRELEKTESERSQRQHMERVRGLESQLSETGEKYENLRVRVRKDIRKIRENERDLEARLELMRKDSSTLLQARDEKVLELQRKIDALEFDLDQVQDSRVQAQMEAERYLAKLSRVSRALQIATSMIEDDRAGDSDLDELEPFSGGAANAEEVEELEPAAAASPGSPADELLAEAEEPSEGLPPELAALAIDGEPTQMLDAETLQKMGGEPDSSSG